jgi:hypothetical protein
MIILAIACALLAATVLFSIWCGLRSWLEEHHARMRDEGLEP